MTDVYALFASADFSILPIRFKPEPCGPGLRHRGSQRAEPCSQRVRPDHGRADQFRASRSWAGAVQPIAPQSQTFRHSSPKGLAALRSLRTTSIFTPTGASASNRAGSTTRESAAIVDSAFNQFIGTNVLIDDPVPQGSVERVSRSGSRAVCWMTVSPSIWPADHTSIDDMQFFRILRRRLWACCAVVSNIDEVEIFGGGTQPDRQDPRKGGRCSVRPT